MVDTSGVQPGGGSGQGPTGPGGLPNPFIPAKPADDAWLKFAQQMFPNDPNPGQYVAGLKQNMMQMFGATISEINTRHQREVAWEKENNPQQ